MNSVENGLLSSLFWLCSAALACAADGIDYGKANPPWKTGRYYNANSQYKMTLNNIVLDVKNIRKAYEGWWWHHDEKVEDHYYSEPFSGQYICNLDYRTFAADLPNKNNGSVFRSYDSAEVAFKLLDDKGRKVFTDAEPSWLRRVLFGPRQKEVSAQTIATAMLDADFMFREVFMTDGQNLDTRSWYFFAWKGREAFDGTQRHHMDVFKKAKAQNLPEKDLEALTQTDRAKIQQGKAGSDAAAGWSKAMDMDLGYNIAQAEAKMMTYALYGQTDTRTVGDVWAIDAETLEAFFPLQSKDRKPFSFEGGVLVLTVESDDDGIVTVKSLPVGRVDGMQVRTDLRIQPRTADSEHRPTFSVDMQDQRKNYVRLTIDSMHEICQEAEMHMVLADYRGAVPKVEQLMLDDPDHYTTACITDGAVILHCKITTQVAAR